ncbi:hypothetical protein BH10ACI3_BH10ACI3_20210 [soil metagenome]
MNKLTAAIILCILSLNQLVFADFKLRQKMTIDGEPMFDRTVWVKGARERSTQEMGGDDADMAAMMPVISEIRQCDLQQTVKINEKSKKYFILPFFDTSNSKPLPPVAPTTKTTVVKGGNVTVAYNLTDTGERKQAFGFTARHLILKVAVEYAKDSCNGESKMSSIDDGWYINLMPESAKCAVPPPPGKVGPDDECRDKVVLKGVLSDPGFMLEGTKKMYDGAGKLQTTIGYETLDVSKSPLEMSLFEIPTGFTEVNSEQSLMSFNMNMNSMAGMVKDREGSDKVGKAKKAVGVDFFSGNVSKLNQQELRLFVADRISANGQEGMLVMSQTDASSGAFSNVIGVEVRSVKESNASKIGGLFGKVTGDQSAAAIGKSEAEVVVTLFGKDGKTVVATGTAKEKVDGKADDAVKAAIATALSSVLPKLK